MTDKQPAQFFDWATELSGAQGHVTLSAKEANEIGARLRSMGEKLKTYEDLDEAASDVQLLRMGYAAARLEIESLRARSVAPDPRPVVEMCAKALAEELAAWDIDPPLHHVKEAHDACELWLAAIDADRAMRAAQPEGAQQPGAWVPLPGTLPDPGKPVLLDIGDKYPIRAMWAAKHTLEVGMEDDSDFGEYDEATDTYYCPEGWYEWNEYEDVHWHVDKTPVAWRELPPKEQK